MATDINKYHFVIFADNTDYLRIMFKDVIDRDNVEFIYNAIPFRSRLSPPARVLYRIWFSKKVNSVIKMPFKERWYKDIYTGKDKDNLCFIFFMDCLLPQYIPLFEMLKKSYPTSKFVLYLIDLIDSRQGCLDTSLIPRYMDLVVSYDKHEAEKMGCFYYPNFLSKLEVEEDQSIPESDFCFIGVAKDRIEDIERVNDTLTGMGYKCDFIVVNSNKKQHRSSSEGIRFINNPIPYSEYIKHILRTKCIVEIQQKKSDGFTLRTWETILYGKKLLTNNDSLVQSSFFSPDIILLFKESINKEDIDTFLSRNDTSNSESLVSHISPQGFLEFIEGELFTKKPSPRENEA